MANWLAKHLDEFDKAGWPVHRRDRNSLHLRRPDGAIEAEISTSPLHFRSENGVWQPIDTALTRSTRGSQEYRVDGLPISVRPDGLVSISGTKHRQRTRRLVIFDVAKRQVVKTLAEFGDGVAVDDCLLRGPDSFRHALQVLPDGLREDVTIGDAISGVRASEWLMLETEIMGASWPDGWLKTLPSVGDYRFPAPTLQDASGRTLKASMYTLSSGVQLLYTGVPLAVLGGLRFPVVLDPTFTATGTITWFGDSSTSYADARTTYTDSLSYLQAGQIYEGGHSGDQWTIYRARLTFDTTSLIDQYILAGVLRLSVSSTFWLTFDVEVTTLDANSDYLSAATATKETTWKESGQLTPLGYSDSKGLDVSRITDATTFYGLLSSRDRAEIEPAEQEYMAFDFSAPQMLVILYEVPPGGALMRHPGMGGGING